VSAALEAARTAAQAEAEEVAAREAEGAEVAKKKAAVEELARRQQALYNLARLEPRELGSPEQQRHEQHDQAPPWWGMHGKGIPDGPSLLAPGTALSFKPRPPAAFLPNAPHHARQAPHVTLALSAASRTSPPPLWTVPARPSPPRKTAAASAARAATQAAAAAVEAADIASYAAAAAAGVMVPSQAAPPHRSAPSRKPSLSRPVPEGRASRPSKSASFEARYGVMTAPHRTAPQVDRHGPISIGGGIVAFT